MNALDTCNACDLPIAIPNPGGYCNEHLAEIARDNPNLILDLDDLELVETRMAQVRANRAGQAGVGDFVYFNDGTMRRISHDWGDEVQTSDETGGSYYLGDGYLSYSGGLYPSVPKAALYRLPPVGDIGSAMIRDPRPGKVWIFHHDQHRAHNGVGATAEFPVWLCDLEPPR